MKKEAIYTFSLLAILFLLVACSVEPKPIPYGQANCAHCNMTVADNRYGAELVNDKGKAIFFDSAECLAAFVIEQPEQGNNAAYLMVTDYTNPNQILDAREAHFLQSRELPSPMGMFLTAVADKATAEQMQQEHGGRLLNWDQVVLAVQHNEKPD
ncbi:nitrous oxide reductase accessory protein NosL [Pontibacter litorisediminis]|uniref:nitrous oxide reductase accessory protein NosL n=1 Tax=Pontibacter litorisediminis TaxID=1846260 RepID=UPI0023EC9ED8|nr:nitrous oxide reductase accessory protein NosL [Pontibacter litorisediminis]